MNLKLTHKDGATNQTRLFPSENKKAPLIIISPAMGVRASYYKKMAENFARQGLNACTVDYRGTGTSSLRASRKVDFGYETLVQDLEDVSQALKKEFPGNKHFLLGHSLGGQIGALHMSRFKNSFDGLILIAACMVYYKGWEDKGSFRVKAVGRIFPMLANLFGYFPGKQVGFGGREAKTVMKDWGINAKTGTYKPTGSRFDYETALAKFSAHVLAMSLEGDTFAPQKAVANLVNKLGPGPGKEHRHIHPQEAGMSKLTHFNWVKESDFFVKTVKEWVQGLA